MAKIDRFYIGMIDNNASMDSSLRPFAIPDNAFENLINAYVFRGRVRKRFGSTLMNGTTSSQLNSRVRIALGMTDDSGDFSATVPGTVFDPGQMFSIGAQMFTVYQDGTPADMLSTGAATGTYDTTSGAVVITGAAVTTNVYFYPATAIIGLITYEASQLDNEPVYAFDTQFSYKYSGGSTGAWQVLDNVLVGGSQNPYAIWSGPDYKLIWGSTYRGIHNYTDYLFVTNFFPADGLRYWDGSTWNLLNPVLNGIFRLITAQIIVPFQDRLVVLNTIESQEGSQPVVDDTPLTSDSEGSWTYTIAAYSFVQGQTFVVGTDIYTLTNITPYVSQYVLPATPTDFIPSVTFDPGSGVITVTGGSNFPNANVPVYYLPATGGSNRSYVNRCRFSQNGSPVSVNSWIDSTPGMGGYIDAPTKEQIVTCQLLKNRLIVYFETSTWELVYTGNQVLPFRWQQINPDLGCQSPQSVVQYDKFAIAIGNTGVHACNGSNVERIDQKIPDEVFNISNNTQNVLRVTGIRDYFVEMLYWTFPSALNPNLNYPNRVLVYNYKTGSWSFNDDSITAFGYYQAQDSVTWANSNRTWAQSNVPWNSATHAENFRQTIAGNQQGYVFIIDSDESRNAPALQISNITVVNPNLLTLQIINHNLETWSNVQDPSDGDYILIENVQGDGNLTSLNGQIFQVITTTGSDQIYIDVNNINGGVDGYFGGGTVARVSSVEVKTKQFNFYSSSGLNVSVNKVDFLVDRTTSGEMTVDYYVSSSNQSTLNSGQSTGALMGTGVLETRPYPYSYYELEQSQTRLWRSVYPQANGQCVQLDIYMSNSEIMSPVIALSDFQLHAMIFYATPTSRLQ